MRLALAIFAWPYPGQSGDFLESVQLRLNGTLLLDKTFEPGTSYTEEAHAVADSLATVTINGKRIVAFGSATQTLVLMASVDTDHDKVEIRVGTTNGVYDVKPHPFGWQPVLGKLYTAEDVATFIGDSPWSRRKT
jgi:hypothetical protein